MALARPPSPDSRQHGRATAPVPEQPSSPTNIWFSLLKTLMGWRREGRRALGTAAPLAVPLGLAPYRGRSCSFNRKKTCFDSSGMQSALCCPFPAVGTGAWLLALVAANFVSLTGRKRGDFCPAARVRSGLCPRAGPRALSLVGQRLFFLCLCAKAQLDSVGREGREWCLPALNTAV